MFKKRAIENIVGTQLLLYADGSRVKQRGKQLVIYKNSTFEFVNAIGDGRSSEARPPDGKRWVKDHNSCYWEVDDADLSGKYEDAE